jgi:hypothetical protein
MTTDIRRISRTGIAFALVAITSCGGKDPVQPTQPTLASIDVTPGAPTLASLGETVQLQAAGKTSSGSSISASFAWSSSATGVATVSTTGLVTAVGNGAANIIATSGSITGMVAVTVSQVAASVGEPQGDAQSTTVSMALDSMISVAVLDALGSPVAGVGVEFAPTTGSGSVDPTTGTTGADGRVATAWTLGTAAGVQTVTASIAGATGGALDLTATAFAADPATIELYDGDAQTELIATALRAPIRVRALDQHGNPVPDVPVQFATSSDDGVDASEALTDLDGIAAVTWTLGTALGAYQATASVPDSTVGDVVGLPVVTFGAQAVAYDVSGLDATTPVVGQTVTILGAGFDPTPTANTVTIGGVAATVVGGSQTALEVTVPSFGCAPVAQRSFVVARGVHNDSVPASVEPASALRLGVGQRVVLDDPNDYCLQFLPAAAGEEYLVGMTSTRRLAGEMAFSLSGWDGVGPQPTAASAPPLARASAVDHAPSPELRLRAWEERFFDGDATVTLARPRSATAPTGLGGPTAAPPSLVPVVGEVLPFRVPRIDADPCNDYTAISATVLAVGPRVVIALDDQVTAGPLLLAGITTALNGLITVFGNQIWALGTQYFGLPTDLDANDRITVVLSPAVGTLGVPAFTAAVDHVARTQCPASDEGEIIYVNVPAAPTLLQLTDLMTSAQPDLAHQLTHVIQNTRRLSAGSGALPMLLSEGQAEAAIEIIGMAIRGDAPRQDYGAAQVTLDLLGLWYRPRFDRLSYVFGWDGAAGNVAGAPETCSLFGFGGIGVACRPEYAPGMAWGFTRYVTDRFGVGFAGGEQAFHQALVTAGASGDVLAGLESLTGESIADIMVEWAMTLYTDGQIAAAAAADLQFSSWNLGSVYGSLPVAQRPQPDDQPFASWAANLGVVGGGTSYTRIQAAGAHGPLAVRARDPIGGVLSAAMAPRLWVVRVN